MQRLRSPLHVRLEDVVHDDHGLRSRSHLRSRDTFRGEEHVHFRATMTILSLHSKTRHSPLQIPSTTRWTTTCPWTNSPSGILHLGSTRMQLETGRMRRKRRPL